MSATIEMSERGANFWQDHSLHYLEMAFRVDRCAVISNPDGYGKRTGKCGDTIEMFIFVSDDRIQTISFNIDGCINTNACANTVAVLAEGKAIDNAWEISADMVIDYLQTLPPENIHCAELAVGAFYLALSDYCKRDQVSWKKTYPTKNRT